MSRYDNFDQQVVCDAILKTLVGGVADDLAQRAAWLKHIADQIHAIDPDGPGFPTGSIGLGDMFDFAVAAGHWRSEHRDAKIDPITPPA